MCRNEIFQYIKSLTEVGFDRKLDGVTGCICHKSSHTSKLFNLLIGTTGSGIRHHEDVVVCIKSCKKCSCDFIIRLLPNLDNTLVSLLFCKESTAILSCYLLYSLFSFCKNCLFLCRHCHVGNRNRHGCTC